MKTSLLFVILTVCLVSCKPGGVDCVEGDCVNGRGKQVLTIGETYEGGFKDGKRHGKGVLYNEIFDVTYDAVWQDGELHGRGTEDYGPESGNPGAKFVGAWKKGKKDGHGEFKYGDIDDICPGESYVGEYSHGMATGKGRYSWPDGGWAEGDFVNEIMHGQAVRYWPASEEDDTDAQTYTGGFQVGFQHGFGTLVWESGGKYEGDWERGVYHGKGKYTFDDGDVFEGEWINGECEEFDDYVMSTYYY